MKTSIINKISKLTLTLLCALSVSALNVFAQQSLYVNGTAYVEPGAATYSATSTARAALEVLGTSAAGVHGSYTGTGITISSTFGTGNGRYGIYVYRSGTLTLTDGSISTDGSNGGSYAYGIYVTGTSVADLQEVNVTTKGLRGHALQAEFSSTLSLVGGMLYASGSNAWGISAATFATVSATNVMIHTDGVRYGYAVQAAGDAEVLLTDVTISTSGDEGIGLRSVGTIRMTGGSIQTSGSQGQGMQSLEGGLVEVTNVTVKTSGQDAYGGYLNSSTDLGGAMYLNNVTIETTGMGANGVNVLYTGTTDATTTLVVNGGSINAQQAIGIAINAPSVATTRSVDYLKLVQGDYDITIGGGASVTGETAALALSSIRTGTDAAGNLVEVDTATMIDFQITENSTIAGDVTVAGSATAAINFDDSTLTGDIITIDKTVLTVTASNGAILTGDVISSATSTIGLTLSGSDTTLTGTLTGNNNSTLEVTVSDHSTITGDLIGTGSSTLAITVNDNGTLAGDLTTSDNNTTTVTISDSGIINGDLTSTGNSTLGVTVSDNGTLTGNLTASDNSSLTLGISEDSTVIGNITGSGSSTLDITISDNSTLAGNLTTSDDTITTVTISDGGTITGDFTASGNSDLTLDLSENGTVSGNITGTGSSTLDITVSDSGTLAGNITTSEDNNTTVNVSAGGAIIGDLTGSDNSTLAVTVDDGGTLTGALNGEQVTVTVNTGGNVTINQDSDFNALANSGNVTVDTGSVIIINPITGNGTTTINDSGNLTASFDGGNGSLVINPGGGVNLTQDSNLGTINNDGTLNVGDYQVSVSDLANNGTIDIAVNTDSGAHGTLHVTGSSSGAGTIHVTSTGDGQANPNDILGNLITGSGVGNYTWDEVDWGLEELIVTPNPDGSISIKEDGTSPAGAVLNSAIAVQQSLWFAQQNSLLKRMGDLRYGARASRPLADKDVRAPYNSLIENIWLRSYGQQLNIGSQVAGKAYEQLIYGVDLGTDHKFTISADSDLYLGVFAGYGRSDLDYRTPGTDGEINSYYGGLYATWLHSSGFYLDATVKAASVDNNLKAPHGDTQLKANYSDINLGGSLEIGKKFTFADAWFIEPQFQVNYLHILAEDYTAGHMNLKAQDLDALQLRLGSLFGRTIQLTNSGALQPYIKISGVETISSGGTLRNGYQHTRANTDGARAELGGGIIWQLNANNQLHLDYEASFGDKYDKPWGLTAGYRHQF